MSSRFSARKLKRLMERNERVIEADRRFFMRRPDREHRLRLASTNEVQMHIAAGIASKPLPDGQRLFCVVRDAGVFRLRAYFPGPAAYASRLDELTEDQAAHLYRIVQQVKPQVAEIEQEMAALHWRGAP
jgi:hypothetical protein